jgi:plasmid stabilization system protein ParE
MQRLIWSPEARDDLRTIGAWLGERDPQVALDTLRAIRHAADRLREYPRIGRAISEPFRVFGIRSTPYLLVYRLSGMEIDIIRIRHRRENWSPVEGEL